MAEVKLQYAPPDEVLRRLGVLRGGFNEAIGNITGQWDAMTATAEALGEPGVLHAIASALAKLDPDNNRRHSIFFVHVIHKLNRFALSTTCSDNREAQIACLGSVITICDYCEVTEPSEWDSAACNKFHQRPLEEEGYTVS